MTFLLRVACIYLLFIPYLISRIAKIIESRGRFVNEKQNTMDQVRLHMNRTRV